MAVHQFICDSDDESADDVVHLQSHQAAMVVDVAGHISSAEPGTDVTGTSQNIVMDSKLSSRMGISLSSY